MDSSLVNGTCTLTPREKLGFDWEVETQQCLRSLAIPFSGNPQDPSAWKREGCGNNKPKQHRRDIETQTLQMECKCVRHPFYPSYLEENVFPRFKDNGKTKVVITNNKNLWSQVARDELAKHNIRLWNHSDLKDYFKNPTFTSIYNYIKTEYRTCTRVVKQSLVNLKSITLNLILNTIIQTKKLLLDDILTQKKNDTLNPKTESHKKTTPHCPCNPPTNFLEFPRKQTHTSAQSSPRASKHCFYPFQEHCFEFVNLIRTFWKGPFQHCLNADKK